MTYRFEAEGNPWMFQRDEIDLMEDELEQLYQTHERLASGETRMEQSVLKEQLDTEEMVEAELVLRWGSQMLERNSAMYDEPVVDVSVSIRELLHDHAHRDPLYAQAYVWANEVFHFAKEQYCSLDDQSRDMFRVYLNVKLIPIKLSIGRMDETRDDAFAFHVMCKEHELALIYLERTLESLGVLVSRGYELLIPFVISGMRLRTKLLLTMKQFGRSHGSPGSL